MKFLITAFDPFGGEEINPALEAVRLLPERIGSASLVKLTVPTVFGASVETVAAAIERERPRAVLCVGQAGGRSSMSVERVAINCIDARIADNDGNQPVDTAVREKGPAAYFSTLPIKKLVKAMQAAGIPAAVSNTAGTFVCNQLLYGVLDSIAQKRLAIEAGFIHVPYLPAQAAKKKECPASMALADIVTGLAAAIGCLEQEYSG